MSPPPATNERGADMLGVLVVGALCVLVVPLPGVIVDGMLALSVALATVTLLVALRIERPLDFSVFPAFLLISTLFRLSLNVATTRTILTSGVEGDSAGKLIRAFGELALGGSVLIGVVVFLILLIVNFMVITKGSGRVSEVAARFTLDALPGKQMSIDADLAAGAITDRVAQQRRKELSEEAEFFGAMDGASKFVRGDAIAGLVITTVNLLGGLVAGVGRDGLSFADALETYTVLTVGDGLLSQLPALFISVAAGIVITKARDRTRLGPQLDRQLLRDPTALRAVAAVMAIASLLPGMPTVAFLGLAGVAVFLSRRAKRTAANDDLEDATTEQGEGAEGPSIQDVISLEAVEVELGLSLVSLIDGAHAELPGRVTALRRQLAKELGVVLPQVHLKDSLALPANTYRVIFRGVRRAEGQVWPDRMMALGPGGEDPEVPGISAKEPAFGLPVRWITAGDRGVAEAQGLSLVDASSVVTTHLGELLRRHLHELVGRHEVQELIDITSRQAPRLVEDIIPNILSLGEVTAVVRQLLEEQISVRDMRAVLEAAGDAAATNKDPTFLTERVRVRLSRTITDAVVEDGVVRPMTIAPDLEAAMRQSMSQHDGIAMLALDVDVARQVLAAIDQFGATQVAEGHPVVILAPTDLRRPLRLFAARFVNDVVVVSARELAPGTRVDPVGVLQATMARSLAS